MLSISKDKCQLFIISTIFFYNSKIFIPNGSTSLFGKTTLVQRHGQPIQRSQASKVPNDRSNNRDYVDLLESNKPGPPKALEAPIGPFKTPEAPI